MSAGTGLGRLRRRAAVPAVLALAVVLVGAWGSPAAAQGRAVPLRADRDRDGLLDDLERRLARVPRGERVSVLVVLEEPATRARVEGLVRRLGGVAVGRRFELFPAFAAELRAEQVERLASFAGVVHVEENATVYAAIDSAQQSFGVAKARVDAGVDGDGDGSPESYSRDDRVAAVVDSGISAFHRDLDEGKVVGWADLVNGLEGPYDDHGHGTAVASVLAGEGDARADRLYQGVAPAAALVGVKVLDRRGRGTVADVVAGVEWVVDMKDEYGIEVVNLSLEQPGCSDGTDALSLAVDAAERAGLLVVAAAGNSGPSTCTVGSPGAAPGALTVGAMADLGALGFRQASFSSRGPTLDGRTKPDLSAPGVDITSAAAGTATGYAGASGTSLAAPFVAGVALLMLDADASLGPDELKEALLATASDWGRGGDGTVAGSRGPDVDYGAGRLDGYAALEAAAARDIGAPPLSPAHVLWEGHLDGAGDVRELTLDVADAAVPVAGTLIVPGGGAPASFDLRLLAPDDAEISAASSGVRQGAVGALVGSPDRYRLQVVSREGSGDFFVDVSVALPEPDIFPPTNVTQPLVTGVLRAGALLTATDGAWEGTQPLVLARRWQRCSGADPCGDIEGATEATYRLRDADVGKRIRLVVRGENAAGWVEAVSAATSVVAARLPRIAAARADAVGHRVVVYARTLGCAPCRVEVRLETRLGARHVLTAPLRRLFGSLGLPGRRWTATLRRVPLGSWRWRVRAVDLDSGETARSVWRPLRLD